MNLRAFIQKHAVRGFWARTLRLMRESGHFDGINPKTEIMYVPHRVWMMPVSGDEMSSSFDTVRYDLKRFAVGVDNPQIDDPYWILFNEYMAFVPERNLLLIYQEPEKT